MMPYPRLREGDRVRGNENKRFSCFHLALEMKIKSFLFSFRALNRN